MINSFKVLYIDKAKHIAHVAYGPIKFVCQVIERDGMKPLILKPSSIYIDAVDFYEMISAVRSAWQYND
jgi:hypothetical protein